MAQKPVLRGEVASLGQSDWALPMSFLHSDLSSMLAANKSHLIKAAQGTNHLHEEPDIYRISVD